MALPQGIYLHHVLDPVTVPVIALPICSLPATNSGRMFVLQPRAIEIERRLVQAPDLPTHTFLQSFVAGPNIGKCICS